MKHIKLAYIGGGSRQWARVFMNDLALADGICGEVALYDIDEAAARDNRRIGERLNAHPDTVSRWDYVVCRDLDEALTGADFVAVSILPGTLDDMAVDVHAPEAFGVYQSVGDTVGPGGVLRAMRTVPIFEGFAHAIRRCCPKAWVINLTNPMTICVKTLKDVFPEMRVFGCCHEVFHAEDFLCCVLKEQLGVPRPDRHELTVDASGINHFTWITKAVWRDTDVLSLLPAFIDRFYDTGYTEKHGKEPWDFRDDPFSYGNKVKMDLFRRYGVLAAAGDRHLAEFFDASRYLSGPNGAEEWLFHLTSVDYRKADRERKLAQTAALVREEGPLRPEKSDEELILLMKAILGLGPVVSNANTVNEGQMSQVPIGSVVEVNHLFDRDTVRPLCARPLPGPAASLVLRNAVNIEDLYAAIRRRDLSEIRNVFLAQPLLSALSAAQGDELFQRMILGTRECLAPYYDLSDWK